MVGEDGERSGEGASFFCFKMASSVIFGWSVSEP